MVLPAVSLSTIDVYGLPAVVVVPLSPIPVGFLVLHDDDLTQGQEFLKLRACRATQAFYHRDPRA